MDAGRAGGRPLDRLLHHRAHAALVDVAHREGADPGGLDGPALRPGPRRGCPRAPPARPPPSAGSPARLTRLSAPCPSTAASGMPWMLPLGLVSGVLASACASNQTRPSFSRAPVEVARQAGDRAHRDRVVAAEHHRQRCPAATASPTRSRSRLADLEDLLQVLEPRVAGPLRLLDLDGQVAPVLHLVAEGRDLRVHVRPRAAPRVPCRRRGAPPRGRGARRSASTRGFAMPVDGRADASTPPRQASTRGGCERARSAHLTLAGSGSDNPERAVLWRLRQRRKTAPAAAPEAPELLAVLVAQKVLTPEQAEKVRRAQKVNGLTAEQAILQLGVRARSRSRRRSPPTPGCPTSRSTRSTSTSTSSRRRSRARSRASTAWSRSRRPATRITIAVHDPFAPFPLEDIKRVTGLDVERVVATRSDVETVNKGFYDLKIEPAARREAAQRRAASRRSTSATRSSCRKAATELDPAAAPVVKALDHILGYAFEQRASDIHFEPKRDLTLVRLRIDGVLHDVHVIPQDRLPGGRLAHQAALGLQPRREAPAAGRPHQARAGRPRGRAARLARCPPPSARRRCCASSTPTSC